MTTFTDAAMNLATLYDGAYRRSRSAHRLLLPQINAMIDQLEEANRTPYAGADAVDFTAYLALCARLRAAD